MPKGQMNNVAAGACWVLKLAAQAPPFLVKVSSFEAPYLIKNLFHGAYPWKRLKISSF